MTLSLNMLFSFTFAILWVDRLQKRRHLFQHFLSWPLVSGMLFQAVALTPIQSFHFRFHHDWSLAYLIDPDLHPALDRYLSYWAFLAALLPLGAALLGHWIARIPLEKPKSKARLIALSTAGGIALTLMAFGWREWLHIGTYEEFFQSEARFLFSTATGIIGVLQLAGAGAFLLYAPRLLDYIPKESSNLT